MENHEINFIDDEEGIIFQLNFDKDFIESKMNNDTIIFAKEFLNFKLRHFNVYPKNEIIGFTSNIDCISIFLGDLIESYISSKFEYDSELSI